MSDRPSIYTTRLSYIGLLSMSDRPSIHTTPDESDMLRITFGSVITPLGKWYVLDYFRYQTIFELVWMQEFNILSLEKLSLSCSQLCFQTSINF